MQSEPGLAMRSVTLRQDSARVWRTTAPESARNARPDTTISRYARSVIALPEA